uniref:MADF domain-containing protein n=1 Tax=Timema douglasi TaxID=61478 RepID=A0A7R8VRH1_TIMDO|nr:unnamed protein product [Timema douglasi]
MNAEKLISCVFVRPELWDQKNKLYSTREAKVIAWAEVGDELGVSGDAAKFKWTSLRDVFRREIKRTLRTSIGRDGISQGRSKWVHFNSMLFLKDQMSIDTQSGANFPQNYIDGDTIKVEDADGVSNFPDGDSLSYVDVGNLGAMTSTSPSYTIQPPRRRKRRLTESEPEGDISETGKQREWFSNGGQVVEDEDYHFLMSVLPSVRQVAPGRKTSFRMKVLELIREEESFVLSERTSFDEYRGGSADNQAQREGENCGVAPQPTKVSFRANKNRWITETIDSASCRTEHPPHDAATPEVISPDIDIPHSTRLAARTRAEVRSMTSGDGRTRDVTDVIVQGRIWTFRDRQ